MTDKTEEQIAREKAAIEAMKNAKANMAVALDRVATLERALDNAIAVLRWTKSHVGPSAYIYGQVIPMVKATDYIDERIAEAQRALG